MTDNTPTIPEDVKKPWISDGVYDFLRANVEFVLPAFAVAYAGLALLWGWPLSAEITGTVGVLGVFIGVVIKTNQNRARNVVVAEKFQEGMELAEAEHKAAEEAARQAWLHETRIGGDLILNTGDESAGLLTVALEKPLAELEGRDEVTLRIKRLDMGEGVG